MKVTVSASYVCKCGLVMLFASEFKHLMYCTNPNCEHYGELFEIPRIELVNGKAYPSE